jgi:hypothetical protein
MWYIINFDFESARGLHGLLFPSNEFFSSLVFGELKLETSEVAVYCLASYHIGFGI